MGFGKRFSYAFRSFFAILSSGEIPEDIAAELVEAPASRPVAENNLAEQAIDSSDRAVQMLALLQRDGRLIDFFSEEIGQYSDAQIGAAVRDVHDACRKSLARYVKLEPIISSEEGQTVTVGDDFDPAAIKLIGNVTGKPPVRGLLRHRGWRITEVSLPPLPASAGRTVVAPAEVEVP